MAKDLSTPLSPITEVSPSQEVSRSVSDVDSPTASVLSRLLSVMDHMNQKLDAVVSLSEHIGSSRSASVSDRRPDKAPMFTPPGPPLRRHYLFHRPDPICSCFPHNRTTLVLPSTFLCHNDNSRFTDWSFRSPTVLMSKTRSIESSSFLMLGLTQSGRKCQRFVVASPAAPSNGTFGRKISTHSAAGLISNAVC
ncbi:unnamed protein product [Arabis nemorensis]|uniref:Uncharacterized protein n=1 Tax=Arabis nemorensis TaxID=586526 RepID=A0A565BUV7_9BRAS|nr:unnamed protein product [Arabis nemorensis]